MRLPILIAGAGPVGLTLAIELARYRVPVRIIDQSPARTDKSKALAVWARTLELLERSGCATSFSNTGLHTHALNILAGSETIAHVPFDSIDSPFSGLLMLPQSETERLLEEHLQTYGVRVERNTELTSFVNAGDRVTTVLTAMGVPQSVDARWLVGCDGARSTVRRSLGLAFEGDTFQSRFVLADVHVQGLAAPDTELTIFWHQDGLVVFFPISPGRYRIIADAGSWNPADRSDPTLADVQAIVTKRANPGITLSAPIWLSNFGVNERKVADYRHGRVFLAGDAAHVHSPAGGQGMNTGMQDAFNLGWKLAMAAHDESAASWLLDTYSEERSAVAKAVLDQSGKLTRVAMLKGAMAQDIRNFIVHQLFGLAAVQHAVARKLAEIEIGYPHSSLSTGSVSGLVGQRYIEGRPFGAGDTPRFAVVAAPDAGMTDILAKYSTLVEPELRAPNDPNVVLLVRPDGYIACAVSRDEGVAVEKYLARLGQLREAPVSLV